MFVNINLLLMMLGPQNCMHLRSDLSRYVIVWHFIFIATSHLPFKLVPLLQGV